MIHVHEKIELPQENRPKNDEQTWPLTFTY